MFGRLASKALQEHGLDLVIADYLQPMSGRRSDIVQRYWRYPVG